MKQRPFASFHNWNSKECMASKLDERSRACPSDNYYPKPQAVDLYTSPLSVVADFPKLLAMRYPGSPKDADAPP